MALEPVSHAAAAQEDGVQQTSVDYGVAEISDQ
jgi:hypothetical protein